jgi:His-Xaa-Ser system protein HxsD
MHDMKIPISKIDNHNFQVVVDLALYAKEAIVAACYKFTDRFYVHQQSTGNIVNVVFESKDNNVISEGDVKMFCNELIDQQIRYNTTLQFGHIRDLIVEEAFKPISQ